MSLTSSDLAMERDSQNNWLPDTVLVKRRVATANSSGGAAFTWPATTHTYAGRLSANGIPDEYLSLTRERGRAAWMVTLPYNADVLSSDRLVVAGHTLEVLGFQSGGAEMTALRVVCAEVL
jgi:head-tail adaptor